eukprot:1732101-Alexandrium_andersonii.AAC.1
MANLVKVGLLGKALQLRALQRGEGEPLRKGPPNAVPMEAVADVNGAAPQLLQAVLAAAQG